MSPNFCTFGRAVIFYNVAKVVIYYDMTKQNRNIYDLNIKNIYEYDYKRKNKAAYQ